MPTHNKLQNRLWYVYKIKRSIKDAAATHNGKPAILLVDMYGKEEYYTGQDTDRSLSQKERRAYKIKLELDYD